MEWDAGSDCSPLSARFPQLWEPVVGPAGLGRVIKPNREASAKPLPCLFIRVCSSSLTVCLVYFSKDFRAY